LLKRLIYYILKKVRPILLVANIPHPHAICR
jgi:hypothetical protein